MVSLSMKTLFLPSMRLVVQALRLLAVVTALVPRTPHHHLHSQSSRSSRRMLLSVSSPLVLSMTLLICLSQRILRLLTLQLRAPLSASSGVLAATVPLVLTRTPLRLLVTTPINMFRHTSSMTPRRPAVSPSATCASVITRSVLLTMSPRQTLLHATFLHTSSRATRWSATLSLAVPSWLTASGMQRSLHTTCQQRQSATLLRTTSTFI